MTEKFEAIMTRKFTSFSRQSAVLLTILGGLGIAAMMNVISWDVVLVGAVLVIISTVGDIFSLGASVLFRTVMLPKTMKRKNDDAVYFDEDELVAGSDF